MVLKENTRYVLRNSETVGPLRREEDGIWLEIPSNLVDGSFVGMWLDDGTSDFFSSNQEPKYDIVSEVS